jgi:uncharacterized LabA/DUF88 family protein
VQIKKENNYAFIDFQNLIKGVESLEWRIDFKKFLNYLKSKYKVTKAILFIGYIKKNESIYSYLKQIGYGIVFKETVYIDNRLKANIDVDLAVTVMLNLNVFDEAVIISGDGDFKILVDLLLERNKFKIALVPAIDRASILIKRAVKGNIASISTLRNLISDSGNEKGPHGDAPS